MWRNRAKAAELADDRDRMRRDLDAQGGDFIRRLEALQRDLLLELDRLRRDVDERTTEIHRLLNEHQDQFVHSRMEYRQFSRAYSDLTRRVDAAVYRLQTTMPAREGGETPNTSKPQSRIAAVDGLEALLSAFYNTLQDRFRGSREEIKRRLCKYLGDVVAITEQTGRPVLDLGAGRGEWLELLAEQGIAGEGVDNNAFQIAEAAEWQVIIHQEDVCSYLARQRSASAGVISAFHIVEHFPFETMVWMVREAMRVLAPGGMLIIETPNPGNVLVGATSFYTDPTHVRPLPAEVVQTLFETLGFHPIEVRFLNPHEKLDLFLRGKRVDAEIAYLLYGAQDIAVLARKPATYGDAST